MYFANKFLVLNGIAYAANKPIQNPDRINNFMTLVSDGDVRWEGSGPAPEIAQPIPMEVKETLLNVGKKKIVS